MSELVIAQAVNFWGAVYPTHCALPHLKKSGGKIFANSSAAAMLAMPRMSFYNVHFSADSNPKWPWLCSVLK
jgi:NAD(P)-dependent dehydrogenase (short-subunit alcohol dehydrogenase family)